MKTRSIFAALVMALVVSIASANTANAGGLLGGLLRGHIGCGCEIISCCEEAPACGCEEEPACGCEEEPACGCEEEPTCGCEEEPSCGCEEEPSCGCEVACCDPCGCAARLLGKVRSVLARVTSIGCCNIGCCNIGCDAGCDTAEPTCGCS